jgi:hypothetical protein
MEHFEMHTEKVGEILDSVKKNGKFYLFNLFKLKLGFETTFKHELRTPNKPVGDNIPTVKVDEELLAEIDEYSGVTGFIDEINEHMDIPYWMRQNLESNIRRRTYPGAPFKRLSEIKNFGLKEDVDHINIDPNEAYPTGHNHRVPDEEY